MEDKVMIIRNESIKKLGLCFVDEEERADFTKTLRAVGQDIFAMTRYGTLLGDQVVDLDLKQAASMLMFIREYHEIVMTMLKHAEFDYLTTDELHRIMNDTKEDKEELG